MAVKLIANYAKKIGLPGYSSHQYSVSVEVEVTNVTEIENESALLYATLQYAVDQQIKETGFVPPDGYGLATAAPSTGAANRLANGHAAVGQNGGHRNGNGNGRGFERWLCTDGQKGFILRLVAENDLKKEEVEVLAQQLFGKGVRQLDKLSASQLIEELLEKTGKKGNGSRGGHYRRQEVRT